LQTSGEGKPVQPLDPIETLKTLFKPKNLPKRAMLSTNPIANKYRNMEKNLAKKSERFKSTNEMIES
jgi:hypothetical protein